MDYLCPDCGEIYSGEQRDRKITCRDCGTVMLGADAIRAYWKRRLDSASDTQVLQWHQAIVDGSDPDDLQLNFDQDVTPSA